jgi:hypothetical protein
MQTRHASDAAFDTWVDGVDQLRTHSTQAAFRAGWDAGQSQEAHDCPHIETVQRLRAGLTHILQGVWTAKNSIDTIRFIAREALAGAKQQTSSR